MSKNLTDDNPKRPLGPLGNYNINPKLSRYLSAIMAGKAKPSGAGPDDHRNLMELFDSLQEHQLTLHYTDMVDEKQVYYANHFILLQIKKGSFEVADLKPDDADWVVG